jgi:hypothetical protein
MAIDAEIASIEEIRAGIAPIHRTHAISKANVEADQMLSAEGKRLQITALNAELKESLLKLRRDEENVIKDAIRQRQERLEPVALGSEIIAVRDAADRADRLADEEEAGTVLTRALRSGDASLSRAVFRRGLDEGWRNVISAYTQQHPEHSDTVRDLAELQALRSNSLARSIEYTTVL